MCLVSSTLRVSPSSTLETPALHQTSQAISNLIAIFIFLANAAKQFFLVKTNLPVFSKVQQQQQQQQKLYFVPRGKKGIYKNSLLLLRSEATTDDFSSPGTGKHFFILKARS